MVGKITEMTAIAALADADIFEVVDDPGGTPLTRKSTFTVVETWLKTKAFITDVGLLYVIDGGGSVLTAGEKGHLMVPFACTINQVTALADASGTVTVDIWKDTYALFPPTNADSITSATPVALSAVAKYQDATLSGWITSSSIDDILAFNVDASPTPATITRLMIMLDVSKT